MPTDAERAAYAAKHYGVKEVDVESKACAYATSLGYWHTKYKSANNRGLPDRQFKHVECREFYIEMKRPCKKARKLQATVIDKMRDHGFLVFVSDDLEKIKRILDDMLFFGCVHNWTD